MFIVQSQCNKNNTTEKTRTRKPTDSEIKNLKVTKIKESNKVFSFYM